MGLKLRCFNHGLQEFAILSRQTRQTADRGGDEDASHCGGRRLPIYRLAGNSEKVDVKTKKPASDGRVFLECFGKRP